MKNPGQKARLTGYLPLIAVGMLLWIARPASAAPPDPGAEELADRRMAVSASLPAPQQIEPAAGAHTTGSPSDPNPGRVLYAPLGLPCFRWQPVSGATSYHLQVAETPQDTALVLSIEGINQTRYCSTAYDQMARGIQDGLTYYWRVRAWGGSPAGWGDWASWRSFTRHWGDAPTLLTPAASAVLTRAPVLSWTAVDGAEYYWLEVSSDPNFPANPPSPNFTYRLETRNTAYVLGVFQGLPNDEDIYWRVRAVGGGNVGAEYRVGPWSDNGVGRKFSYCWSCNLESELGPGNERRPVPLTPVNNEDHVNSAYFSWTPVEGVASYHLQVSLDSSFAANPAYDKQTPNTGVWLPTDGTWGYDPSKTYYWRVRAINSWGYAGEWNNEPPNISASFRPESPSVWPIVPDLLFPEYYYEPIYNTPLWDNRAVGTPTFMWNQVRGAVSYTVQVAKNLFFTPLVWELTTENLSATPLSLDSWGAPDVYYWRVQAGAGAPWSQVWKTRVDPARQVFTPTAAPPRLLRPTYQVEGDALVYGQLTMEHFPSLEWLPVSGAHHYEIQIATDDQFSAGSLIETTETRLVNYTPVTRYPPDTYFWRVRAEDAAGNPLGTGQGWSQTYHFALARQFASQQVFHPNGVFKAAFVTPTLLTEDPLGDQNGGRQFDLGALYASLDNSFWYFGWSVYTSTQPVRFQLYLDAEGADGQGVGVNPYPLGDSVPLPNAAEPYRPEYAVQWDMFGASGLPTVTLFSISGTGWSYYPLLGLGGGAYFGNTPIYSGAAGFVALALPHTSIRSPSAFNALLVALDPNTNQIMDVMDLGYVTVSTSPTPRTPPNSHVDPARRIVYTQRMPLFTWNTLTNIETVRYRVGLDLSFAQIFEEGNLPGIMSFSSSNPYYLPLKVYPDNTTYYWQLCSYYKDPALGGPRFTTWGRPVRFTKQAQTPTNLSISGAVMSGTILYVDDTPVFTWDVVQGAATYQFELSIGNLKWWREGVGLNAYIPIEAIPNGDAQWKVRIIDGSGNWSPDHYAAGAFHKGSDIPQPLFPLAGSSPFTDVVYFRWAPLERAAYYILEVAADRNFSVRYWASPWINNTIYVPLYVPDVVREGIFYWRLCAYNGSGHKMGCERYYIDPRPNYIYLPAVLRR